MILFVLLVGVTSAMAAPTGMPSFKINGYSRSNVPEMTVTFENGVKDDLVLEPYSKTPCNFIGGLKTHSGSAAVTGCLNNPESKMHITLLSELNTKSSMYELDFYGQLTALENPFKYQKESSGIKGPVLSRCLNDTFDLDNDKMGDELEDMKLELEAEEEMKTSKAVSWPSKVYAYVKFGYDKTMKAQLATEGKTIAAYIDTVMTHVQTYYKHNTLPTQILFKYNTAETIFVNENWPSTDYLDNACAAGEKDGDKKVDLYAWFGKDPSYYGTVGLAYVGTACKTFYKTSFNEWRKTPVATAMVVAHEMGHNFGMSHDFDNKHGGDNSACNGQGIMSYGDAPAKWSSCSVSDFTGYYELRNWGPTCLKDWNAYVPACGDLCPGKSCPINPQSFCTTPDRFGGCKGRYRSYFEQLCKGTCGLC